MRRVLIHMDAIVQPRPASEGDGFARAVASRSADRTSVIDGRSRCARRGVSSWLWGVAAIAGLATVLALLPGRASIPPLVESDYCYLLTAADMLVDGRGPVAPMPVAPFQPWSWQADWAFLTKWPVGYPLLVAGLRSVFGITSIAACRVMCIVACAAALVGWFLWIKRIVPAGITGVLVAAVGAGCAVSTASLINPSTDLLVGALLPYVLLLVVAAVARFDKCQEGDTRRLFSWPSPDFWLGECFGSATRACLFPWAWDVGYWSSGVRKKRSR